ncbi:MAG: hypothetical protein GY869_27040 [Planctomycetes bacterium]|nr:hypothetical protein [Planctomycetota bacterium]
MMVRNVSLLAIVAAIGLLFLLVHLFKSKDNNQKRSGSGHFGLILLFLVGVAFAFLITARLGIAIPLRGLHLPMPDAMVILVLVFLVMLLAWVFHDKQHRWRRAGILVLFVMVLVLLAGLFTFRAQSVRTSSPQEYAITTPDPAIWSDGVEKLYSADIYPSKTSAVRALGNEIVTRIQKMRPHIIKERMQESAVAELIGDPRSQKMATDLGEALLDTIAEKKVDFELDEFVANIPVDRIVNIAMQPDDWESNVLVIKLVQGRYDRELFEELREVIIDGIDDCRCEIVRRSSEVDTAREEIGISLEIDTVERAKTSEPMIIIERGDNYTRITEGANDSETNSDVGTIEARIFSANYDRRAIEVRFTEKSWVENFAEYLSLQTELHKQWIQARSSETCFSVEEAHRLSLQDAAQRVGGYLKGLETTRVKVVPEDLLNCDMIVDQFSQSFDGSEGMVWRKALLVDVSEPKLKELRFIKEAALASQRRDIAFLGVSFLGMLGIICLLYALANAATKGYYSTVLRFFAVIIIIAAVIGLLNFT